jgi:hypothetical protein
VAQKFLELVEAIFVYRFPELSRQKVESMLGLSNLKQTRVDQEALEEERQEEGRMLLLQLLKHRFETLPTGVEAQIQTFSWSDEDLQARLNRLRQDTLARTNRMKDAALSVIPLVEWAFYQPITTAKELAQRLAEVSRRIEQAIPTVYDAERSDGYLHTLLTSFQRELLPTLKLKADNDKDYSFADIYAQTIAYGLFTARVFSYTIDERRRQDEADPARKETDFNREDAWELLPETNPFLRRLFRDVSKVSMTGGLPQFNHQMNRL